MSAVEVPKVTYPNFDKWTLTSAFHRHSYRLRHVFSAPVMHFIL